MNINYVMNQILKLSCVSFSYVSISYVLALTKTLHIVVNQEKRSETCAQHTIGFPEKSWLKGLFKLAPASIVYMGISYFY